MTQNGNGEMAIANEESHIPFDILHCNISPVEYNGMWPCDRGVLTHMFMRLEPVSWLKTAACKYRA